MIWDFLSHTQVQGFLGRVWCSRCPPLESDSQTNSRSTGPPAFAKRLKSWMQTWTPQTKYLLRAGCFGTFIVTYCNVVLNMQHPFEPDMRGNAWRTFSGLETVFWFWVFSQLADEYKQLQEEFSTLSAYLRGSGNRIDVVMNAFFLLSAFLRAISLGLSLHCGDMDVDFDGVSDADR